MIHICDAAQNSPVPDSFRSMRIAFGEDDINAQRALRGRAQDSGTSPRRARADAGEESSGTKPSEGEARAEAPLA